MQNSSDQKQQSVYKLKNSGYKLLNMFLYLTLLLSLKEKSIIRKVVILALLNKLYLLITLRL